jgi:hypothetical protein
MADGMASVFGILLVNLMIDLAIHVNHPFSSMRRSCELWNPQ